MYDSDEHDTISHSSGYTTPPLSPTKSISTEGWLSPRTPSSPRKTRSCVFTRDVGDNPFITPPRSPAGLKFRLSLSALSIPELLATCKSTSLHSDDDSPTKPKLLIHRSPSSSCQLNAVASPHGLSPPKPGGRLDAAALSLSSELEDHSLLLDESQTRSRGQRNSRGVSESLRIPTSRLTSPTLSHPGTFAADVKLDSLPPSADNPVREASPAQAYRSPLRCASSPLRPGQYATRGCLISTPNRKDTSTPDRFIASRRPPAVTRDSFKLNRPSQRLEFERVSQRGALRHSDAFSRRLRRSGRMNDELRGLRQAHSVIIGRATASERNNNFRRGSTPLGARQISAGAVWNVGGPSAVSDTVVAVSTGRGSMLGRGTNAPLYRSAFLNRADPEAELEAYERRLALALDIDQTERILHHSPADTSPERRHGDPASQTKHVWRDGVWIKDGVNLPNRNSQQTSRRPVPVLPFRYVSRVSHNLVLLT
ncbi:hypothetical protein J1614_004663 [Plenodomus biglobosus]|nr:hypothetical protein J1614_004663 [Plenodomus biglobosus]